MSTMAMKAELVDIVTDMNGKQRVTFAPCADFRDKFFELKDGEVSVEIKKWRNKRSLDANAYAWVLIDKIAAEMSLDKVEVYREALRDIGGVSEPVCVREDAVQKVIDEWVSGGLGKQADIIPSKIPGCVTVMLYFGSSTYNSKQMSSLIDHLVFEAKELGIETLPPHELQAMMDRSYN